MSMCTWGAIFDSESGRLNKPICGPSLQLLAKPNSRIKILDEEKFRSNFEKTIETDQILVVLNKYFVKIATILKKSVRPIFLQLRLDVWRELLALPGLRKDNRVLPGKPK